MKKQNIFSLAAFIAIAICTFSTTQSSQLTREQQLEIIGYYKLIHEGINGVSSESQELMELDDVTFPVKCATPITIPYSLNLKNFDKDIIDQQRLYLEVRPNVTDEFYDSPSGNFKIHYTRSGGHAVYQPNSTTGGVPNYVVATGRIFDSVYNHIINVLGYPIPPLDGGYPSGIDDRYDVYLMNLGGSFFGLTYPDSFPYSSGGLDASSFIEIDNDYQESGFGSYRSNPLNAVRVTAAHEFFHAVHFGIDFTEMEEYTDPVFKHPYWYEMTSTWMEEEIYDDINDYYTVIPFFFNRPRSSIQQFNSPLDFHPYASCVYPLFLSEKFGPDIIREIWIRCGQMGLGPNMLEAADIVIDSITSGAENFRSVFGEFTLWNYFTGGRAGVAPGGIGYEEAAFYPEIPDTAFSNVYQYPDSALANQNPKSPAANAVGILKLHNLRGIHYSDAADTSLRIQHFFGAITSDSLLPQGWHIYRLLQLDSDTSVYIDSSYFFPDNNAPVRRIYNPRDYRTATFLFAPASWRYEVYTSSSWDTRFGYIILDSLALIANKPSSVLSPYPNPANISQMGGADLTFRFQIGTDTAAFPLYMSPYTSIDIFTVAGERVATVEAVTPPVLIDPQTGTLRYELQWDMTSQAGTDLVSGVYVCIMRMYDNQKREELFVEETAKVLIVR